MDFNKCALLLQYPGLGGLTAARTNGKQHHELLVTHNVLIDVAVNKIEIIIKCKLD